MSNESIDDEIKGIFERSSKEAIEYEERFSKELEVKSEKIKKEAINKLEAEKVGYIRSLNQEVVEKVIAKTKAMIGDDRDAEQKITKRLLEGI